MNNPDVQGNTPDAGEEGVPAPWPLKLLMTGVPFLLVAALLFLDRCGSG